MNTDGLHLFYCGNDSRLVDTENKLKCITKKQCCWSLRLQNQHGQQGSGMATLATEQLLGGLQCLLDKQRWHQLSRTSSNQANQLLRQLKQLLSLFCVSNLL